MWWYMMNKEEGDEDFGVFWVGRISLVRFWVGLGIVGVFYEWGSGGVGVDFFLLGWVNFLVENCFFFLWF